MQHPCSSSLQSLQLMQRPVESTFDVCLVAGELAVGVILSDRPSECSSQGRSPIVALSIQDQILKAGLGCEISVHHVSLDAMGPAQAPCGRHDSIGEKDLQIA